MFSGAGGVNAHAFDKTTPSLFFDPQFSTSAITIKNLTYGSVKIIRLEVNKQGNG